jgi:uncharacterized protein DUF1376
MTKPIRLFSPDLQNLGGLPDPLIDADADIGGMEGFLLRTGKLMASELWVLSTGEEFKAAMALWMRSWHQSPPGSLPSDDRTLAAFSGAGSRWPKVREMAMRGFVKCSDGKFYHPTLCDEAKRAARSKIDRHERTRAATEARRNKERNEGRNADRDD